MNQKTLFATLFFVTLLHVGMARSVTAQVQQTAGPSQTQAATPTDTKGTEGEIRSLIDRYALSIDRADTQLGSQIWATTEDVSFIHPRGHERGWESVKKNFYEQTMGATFSERKLGVHDISIHVYPQGMAWAEFYWDFDAKLCQNGQPLKTSGRETQIYRKTDQGWRLVHVHYSGPAVTGERKGF